MSYLAINANVWVSTGNEPLSQTLHTVCSQCPRVTFSLPNSGITHQMSLPFPPLGALFLPRPPPHCYSLPPLVAQPLVPGLIVPTYPISPRNDILLALTPVPPPPANSANVYTPVRQFALCCSCPLISPSAPVFMLRLGAPCTKDFLLAAWEAHSV